MAEGNGGQVDWLDELALEVQRVHDNIIRVSGGVPGVHASSLMAACARPFQSVFGKDLYPDGFGRVAALFHGIISGHVFVDGNKRTATVIAIYALAGERLIDLHEVSHLRVRLLGEVAVTIASESISVDEVVYWLRRIFDKTLLPEPETT